MHHQQPPIDELAEHCGKIAGNVADLIEHVRALNEVQHIIFVGLINRSPEIKDYFATFIRHTLEGAKDYSLGEQTVATLKTLESYTQPNPPPGSKNPPHLYLAWPPPPVPPRKPTDPEAP